jgi:hypothetical protein
MVSPRSVEYVHDKFICMRFRKCFMYADGMHTDAHTNAFVMPKINECICHGYLGSDVIVGLNERDKLGVVEDLIG